MSWYCILNGERLGPIAGPDWSRLVAEGRITLETSVWKEGMKEWRPLRDITGALVPTHPPDDRVHECVECGHLLPDEDLMRLGAVRVCAGCKPALLQRMREGAPPAMEAPGRGVFASGRYLVVRYGAVLPRRCVCCNAPGVWSQRLAYSWHPTWLILTLACTPLALVLAAYLFSRTAQLDLVLCERHVQWRRRRMTLAVVWITGGALVLLLGLFGLGSGLPFPLGIVVVTAGLVSLLMGPLFAQRASSVLIARRMTDEVAVMRGVHPEYLAALPPWTGDPI